MSSSPPDLQGRGDGRRQGLTRYVDKVKIILTRDKSKRASVQGPSTSTAPVVDHGPDKTPDSTPKGVASNSEFASPTRAEDPPPDAQEEITIEPPQPTISAAQTASPKTSEPASEPAPEPRQPHQVTENVQAAHQKTPLEPPARSQIQQDKARLLFAKYGLTIDSDEWTFPSITPCARVQKPIRMRIHRHCHQCATAFGKSRVCPNVECSHARCNKCPRYPLKKTRGPNATQVPTAPHPSDSQVANRRLLLGPQTDARRNLPPAKAQSKSSPILTMPSRRGGQDLVHKPIRMRVRRYCHQCSTEFIRAATVCESCSHARCTVCPRTPAKKNKFPDGYPGDVVAALDPPVRVVERTMRKPVRKVKWICHMCEGFFIDGVKVCGGCQHRRCEECYRQPPKKIKPRPDPDVVRSVTEKLAKLGVASIDFGPTPDGS